MRVLPGPGVPGCGLVCDSEWSIRMTKYDFETIIERRGTGSLKWDAWSRRGHASDELPLWVADMDFKTRSRH